MRRWQMEFLGIAAPPFGEAERAAWFCSRFEELGLAGARIDAAGNAVAELRAGEGVPVVMLSAHLDTVFPAGTDCTPREEEAKILGPRTSTGHRARSRPEREACPANPASPLHR